MRCTRVGARLGCSAKAKRVSPPARPPIRDRTRDKARPRASFPFRSALPDPSMLLRLDVRRLDDLCPSIHLVADEFLELRWRHRHRFGAEVREALLDLGARQRFLNIF